MGMKKPITGLMLYIDQRQKRLKNKLHEVIQIVNHAVKRGHGGLKIAITGVLFLIACSQSSRETYTSFPQEVSLTGRAIHTGEIIKSPGRILFIEDAFFVMDSKADYSLHAFAVPDCEYLGSFLRRGRGPDGDLFAVVYMSYPFLRIMNSKNGQVVRELRLDNGQLAPESMNRQSRAMQSQNFTANTRAASGI